MIEQQIRDGNGKFTRTLDTVERQARAAELRSQGLSYRKIAAAMAEEGSASARYDVKNAFKDVEAAMDAVVREPAGAAVQFELDRLDAELVRLNGLYEAVEKAMGREHVTVSQGRVVTTEDGDTVPDDEFLLKCVDRLARLDEQRRRAGESRRRLLGLDQPAKTQLSGGVTYQVVGIDPEELR
ncbi:hypothetical protein [Kitasatospora griseola]|uniref:hypothetical protein n=1 Tax=Kitasatospora griseola TaxID=2064 RepID=UPI003659CF22